MKIVNSDTLIRDYKEYDVILVPMSINNAMNRGFAYDIKLNFPNVYNEEQTTPYGDRRKYGTIKEIVSNDTIFVICYVHTGGFKNGIFIDYKFLEQSLTLVNKRFKDKKVASTIIGVSKYDGNGDRKTILDIFSKKCTDVDLYLYDFEQKDTKYEYFKMIASLRNDYKNKIIDKDAYTKKRSKIEWERKNGIINNMPDGYVYTPKRGKIG